MSEKECPLCGGSYLDLLQHLVLTHDIQDAEHYVEVLEREAKRSERAEEFHSYLVEQRKLQESGEITPEEFRRRMAAWEVGHT